MVTIAQRRYRQKRKLSKSQKQYLKDHPEALNPKLMRYPPQPPRTIFMERCELCWRFAPYGYKNDKYYCAEHRPDLDNLCYSQADWRNHDRT